MVAIEIAMIVENQRVVTGVRSFFLLLQVLLVEEY